MFPQDNDRFLLFLADRICPVPAILNSTTRRGIGRSTGYSMKIYLVDGTYELFRSHFGAPPRKAPDGREVGATLGLLRSLLMLLTTPGITHVACAFDHVIESFRNDLYPGYKTGAGIDPNLLAQFELSEEAVSAAAAGGLVDAPVRGRRCPVQRDRPFQG